MRTLLKIFSVIGWLVVGACAGAVIGMLVSIVTFSVLSPYAINSKGAEQVEWEIYQEDCAEVAFYIGLISTTLLSLVPNKTLRKFILCLAFLSLVVIATQILLVMIRYFPLLFSSW